jgi:hypothetical protein
MLADFIISKNQSGQGIANTLCVNKTVTLSAPEGISISYIFFLLNIYTGNYLQA